MALWDHLAKQATSELVFGKEVTLMRPATAPTKARSAGLSFFLFRRFPFWWFSKREG